MAAVIGWPIAEDLLAFDGSPTTIYEHCDESAVAYVATHLPPADNPSAPKKSPSAAVVLGLLDLLEWPAGEEDLLAQVAAEVVEVECVVGEGEGRVEHLDPAITDAVMLGDQPDQVALD
jgi:hypothetical protein